MKLLLVGATGLVGSHVLAMAQQDTNISQVIAPSRRALPPHPKLLSPIVDYDHLNENEEWWHADAVICTLGTTMKSAGSKQAFRQVDYGYPLAVALLAKQHHTPCYVLNSATGANAKSRIHYNRIKGELEDQLQLLDFNSLTLVRPSLITGDRKQFRLGERVAASILKLSAPVIPPRFQANSAHHIACALLSAAKSASKGTHIIESQELL